jgi:hypothetical protein
MTHWLNDIDRESWSIQRETCANSNFSTTNPAGTDPVFSSELHSARQATNPLNDGTVAVTRRNGSTQCYVTTPHNCWQSTILSIQNCITSGGGKKGVKPANCLTHQSGLISIPVYNFQLRYYIACCFSSLIVRKWTIDTGHDDDYGDDDNDADEDNIGSYVV